MTLDRAIRDRIAHASAATEAASVDVLTRLIEAGRGGREAIDALILREFEALGLAVETLDYKPEDVPLVAEFAAATTDGATPARCLIARTGDAAAEGGRSLILFAHPDPEPFRSEPAWRQDPFTAIVRDGRISGWGVADDLAGIAIMLQSVAVLRQAGLSPAAPLSLVSAPSKSHRRGIAAALHHGLESVAAIYLHPAESGKGLDEIKAFAPGQIEFAVSITGRLPETSEPAHTAFAHLAVSPFDAMQSVVRELRHLDADRGRTVHHPLLQEAVGRSTNLLVTHCEYGVVGGSPRVGPACRIRAAVSLVPGEALADVQRQIAAAVDRAAAESDWLREHPPEISWISGVSAAETERTSAFYQLVAGSLAATGARPVVNPLHTSSDIRNPIVQKGIPTVGYGPLCGGLTMAGGHDEWVDLPDYLRTIAVTAEIVAAWCGTR